MKKISTTQCQIIYLASVGMKNIAIAYEMNLSINTIKYHRKEIFRKLGITSMSEAIKMFYEEEMVKDISSVF